jgi:hypothetical protein
MFRVKVRLNGLAVQAVVDTAAEVTLVSDRVVAQLSEKVPVLEHVYMKTAGRGLQMNGSIVGPVTIQLGDMVFQERVYVAPIEDCMLLGLDFLKKHGATIDIVGATMCLNGQVVPMAQEGELVEARVANVTVARTVVIPPNSVAMVKCSLGKPIGTFAVEAECGDVIVPMSVHVSEAVLRLPMVNMSGHHVRLKQGKLVGKAEEVRLVRPLPEELTSVKVVREAAKCDKDITVPDHLRDLYERSKLNLSDEEQVQVAGFLREFEDVFAKNEYDLGNFTAVEHCIDTGEAKPIRQKMRRTPVAFVTEEENHLKKMLEAGVIQPSNSEWCSAPVLVRKRDGSVRWCVDYRGLNSVTVKDVYPLPLIEDCIDMLAGQKWFSKLDANSAYWQIKIKESDRKKTAFTTKYGLFEFVRMAFGLCNAPATFSRVVGLVLQGLNWNSVLAFLDDILAMNKTFAEHMLTIRGVFVRLRQYQLKLKPAKCELFQHKVEFLGRTVGPEGLGLSSNDVRVVVDWPVPTCSKDVERFLGLVNYHRMFISDYAGRSRALYEIVKDYQWGDDQDTAFLDLKEALMSAPVLGLPNRNDPFVLDTDASDKAIGAVLSQIQAGAPRVVCYGSYALTKEQRRYCTTRKELLAVVRFTRQFRHYLLGKRFTVRTDHSSLTWLLNFKEPQGQIARWMEELSQYDMDIVHRAGKKHANADALSRLLVDGGDHYEHGVTLEVLPCGGCPKCTRAEEQWGGFIREVDDVVSLAPVIIQEVRTGEDSGVESTDRAAPVQDRDALLKEHQWADDDFRFIRKWLLHGTEPPDGELFLANAASKFYWINRQCFKLEADLLWRIDPKSDRQQLLVPRELRHEILVLNHDIPLSGHQGEQRTI